MTKEVKKFRKLLAKGLPDAGNGNDIPVEFMEAYMSLYEAYSRIKANTIVLTKNGKPIKNICKERADLYTETLIGFGHYHLNYYIEE